MIKDEYITELYEIVLEQTDMYIQERKIKISNEDKKKLIFDKMYILGLEDGTESYIEAYEDLHNKSSDIKRKKIKQGIKIIILKLKKIRARQVYNKERFELISKFIKTIINNEGVITIAQLTALGNLVEDIDNGDMNVLSIIAFAYSTGQTISFILDKYIEYKENK